MASADAEKRKADEIAEKPAAAAAAAEPEAKRLKPSPPDPAAVRKQVEYYLSDMNLRYDKFFHDKIAEHKDGWLDLSLVLTCNKMKAMRVTKEDVVIALKESKMEINDDASCIRRPADSTLPALEAKPSHQKKSSVHAHDGGVLALFKGIPEEQSWQKVKECLAEKLPAKVNIWFVSEVSDKNDCTVAVAPFEGDVALFETCELDLGGKKVTAEVCYGDSLQNALKLLPKHIRDKREKELRKRQKERNRPIIVGTQRFLNVSALRGRVREILNSRSDGEQLKKDGSDFKLIMALLEFHPKGAEKSKDMSGIKVAKSLQGDSRCFYMLKEGGGEEDFSAKKCLDAVEANPPYVKSTPAKVETKAADAPAAEPAKEAADAPAAEPAKEAADAPAAEPAKEEEKKEEPAAAAPAAA